MKKNTHLLALGLGIICGLLSTVLLWAGDSALDPQKKNSEKEDIIQKSGKPEVTRHFIVETDEQTATESLDRISGKIDLGFSSPEQVFKSPDQYRSGPFSREKVEAEKKNTPDP